MNRFIYISLVNILLSMMVATKLIGCEVCEVASLGQPSAELTHIEESCGAVYADLSFNTPNDRNDIVPQRSTTSRHTLRRSSIHKSFGYAINRLSKSDESHNHAFHLLTTSLLPLAVKSSSALLVRLRKFRI